MKIIKYISWYLRGKPTIKYEKLWCRSCGQYFNETLIIPDYEQKPNSFTLNFCNRCKDLEINKPLKKSIKMKLHLFYLKWFT
jgi:Pyruvate/2-oxoacid:ferredoxin oxidoreductase delta subunit